MLGHHFGGLIPRVLLAFFVFLCWSLVSSGISFQLSVWASPAAQRGWLLSVQKAQDTCDCRHRKMPGRRNGTRSRGLAWRTPWTEEPGGLQSMASQRVRHD